MQEPERPTREVSERPWRRLAIGGAALAAILAGGVFALVVSGRSEVQPLAVEATPTPTAAVQTPSPTASPLASPAPSATPRPSATSAATPEPTATPAPTPITEATAGYAHNSILRVEVDRLAVRRAPQLTSPLATAWRWVESELDYELLGEVRLMIGDYVSVELGPLVIGDTVWYRVWPAEGAQLNYSTVLWDTRDDGANPVEPGWVAASVRGGQYLSLYQDSEVERSAGRVAAAGTGDYLSEPTETHDLLGLTWTLAENDSGSACAFRLSLEPLEGGATFLALETSLAGTFDEGHEILGVGNRIPVVGEWGDLVRVRVTADCGWAFVLEAWGHD
jgi:hypothetical protein